MSFQDKTLTCVDCGQTFVFTAGEQEFYAQKGFQNAPKRCKSCKATKRSSGPGGGMDGGGSRELFEVVCSSCGQKTTVPFKPTSERPATAAPASSRDGHPGFASRPSRVYRPLTGRAPLSAPRVARPDLFSSPSHHPSGKGKALNGSPACVTRSPERSLRAPLRAFYRERRGRQPG